MPSEVEHLGATDIDVRSTIAAEARSSTSEPFTAISQGLPGEPAADDDAIRQSGHVDRLDDATLNQLRTLWELAPPGLPVRLLTDPLGRALVGAVGPEDAGSRAAEVLGDVEHSYMAALVLKVLAGEVDVLLHAIGIAAALPHVLAPGERIMSVSIDHDGGGTAGSAGLGVGDLVTDRQVAEFTFIRWSTTSPSCSRDGWGWSVNDSVGPVGGGSGD